MTIILSSHTGTLIAYRWPTVAETLAAIRNDDREAMARRKRMSGAWAGARTAKTMDARVIETMPPQTVGARRD